jgi:predicted DNA-binding transcriptional regulator YafY
MVVLTDVPPVRALIRYTNYRGETADRVIVPRTIWFGSTEYHKEPQWLLKAYDEGKADERDFAMRDISSWQPIT